MATASRALRWAIAYHERDPLFSKGALREFVPVIRCVGDQWRNQDLNVRKAASLKCVVNRVCPVFDVLETDNAMSCFLGDQSEDQRAQAAAAFKDGFFRVPSVLEDRRQQFFFR